jgi:hypothetical protein
MNLVDCELYGKAFPVGAKVSLGGSALDFVVLVKPLGATGIRTQTRARAAAAWSGYAFLSANRRVVVPGIHGYPGRSGHPARVVGIYDLSGKCLQKAVLRGDQDAFIAREAVGQGVRIIRMRTGN